MRKILIVEDDGFKSDELRALLLAIDSSADISLEKSVSSAVLLVNEKNFDLVVLDMALPSHTPTPGTGAPLSLLTGGLELLFELQSLEREDRCIIVTQYPEIEICGEFYSLEKAPAAIQLNYGVEVLGCIEYSDSNTHWRTTLSKLAETR